MRGGDEASIIRRWRAEAERRLSDERHRGELGLLTWTFADLAGCRAAWERGLRGWNMQTSPLWDQIRAEGRQEGRAEGRQEGRAEGRTEGRAEGVRATVLQLGRQKFGKAPSRKQQQALQAVTEIERLQALAARVLDVASWRELLEGVNGTERRG
jgi:hypothetical protein